MAIKHVNEDTLKWIDDTIDILMRKVHKEEIVLPPVLFTEFCMIRSVLFGLLTGRIKHDNTGQ